MRVLEHALTRVERDEQARRVDEVHTRLEVVTEAAPTRLVPRKVVAELVLLLFGRLRRVDALPGEHAVRRECLIRILARRRDVVAEIGDLEDELVQLRAPERPV